MDIEYEPKPKKVTYRTSSPIRNKHNRSPSPPASRKSRKLTTPDNINDTLSAILSLLSVMYKKLNNIEQDIEQLKEEMRGDY
jgi:hypothetical protein